MTRSKHIAAARSLEPAPDCPLSCAVIAKDLSGTDEAAAIAGPGTWVVREVAGELKAANGVLVVDPNTHAQTSEVIRAMHRDVFDLIDLSPPVIKEIDSMLRGDLAAESMALDAVRESLIPLH